MTRAATRPIDNNQAQPSQTTGDARVVNDPLASGSERFPLAWPGLADPGEGGRPSASGLRPFGLCQTCKLSENEPPKEWRRGCRDDPLLPSAALLPQCGTRSGGTILQPHQPGRIRPYSATLAVEPVECGKHETTATKWDKVQATEKPSDGKDSPPEPDSVTIPQYDS